MKKRLTLKKVTIRDLDESTLKNVAGGDDTEVGTCAGPSDCVTCGATCPESCWDTCFDTCPNTCAGNTCGDWTCDAACGPGGGTGWQCGNLTQGNGDSCWQNCC